MNLIDDVAAARIADASSLPHPVKLTTGQATQSPRTLTLETAAKKGALGDELQGNALATQELQRQGLETNANIIRQNVAKGQPIAERGSGAAMAQSELTLKRETARKLVSARFKLAKQGNAGISADALSTFRNGLGKSLRADFDVEGLPNVSRLLSQLKAPANTKSINLGALETWRKRVSAAARSAAKGTQSNSATEAAALRRMLGSYDDAIQGSLSDAIVKGSTDDILLWRQAIAGRREFANRFETVPIIDKLSRKVNEGGERVLKVDPADAAATIFGRGILGRKAGLGRDLANLKRELSPQSWNAIKDEATLNLFAAADGTFRSGTEFAKRLDLFTRDAKGIYNQMFDAKERALLGQLSRVAKTIERRPPITGDMNPSGTGAMNAILNKGRSVGGPVGEFVTAFGTRIFDKTARAVKVAEASRYFAGVLEKRTVAVPAVYRAAGIELTNQGMTGQ